MPRFVFDTNVLINYIRWDDQDVHEALMVAAELGEIFISRVSILEMWAPGKWQIREESHLLVPLWIRKLENGEIPEGMLEIMLEKLIEHQQPIPNEFLLSTVQEGRQWFIYDENDQLVFLIEYTEGSIALRSPDIRKSQVKQEISTLKNICDRLGAQIVPISARAQSYAEIIVQYYRDTLGKSVILDSLIIATGLVRRAWLVTTEIKKWGRVAQEIQSRGLPLPKMKVIDPIQLAREVISP